MNLRHPPLAEVGISRGRVWLYRTDAILGAVFLIVGLIACVLVVWAAILRP